MILQKVSGLFILVLNQFLLSRNTIRRRIVPGSAGNIETDFLDEVGFFDNNRELTDPLIKKYSYLQRTSEMRYLEVWNKKVDEIVDVIKEEKMTLENIKDFTAILLKVDDLLDQRDKISTRMAKRREKEGDSALIGGGILSLMEEGKI